MKASMPCHLCSLNWSLIHGQTWTYIVPTFVSLRIPEPKYSSSPVRPPIPSESSQRSIQEPPCIHPAAPEPSVSLPNIRILSHHAWFLSHHYYGRGCHSSWYRTALPPTGSTPA